MPSIAKLMKRPVTMFLLAAVILSLGSFFGCSSDDSNDSNNNGGGTPATTSSFAGWFANGVESGQLGLTVGVPNLARKLLAPSAAQDSVSATGTLVLTGTTVGIPLTGTFSTITGELHLAGGGYTLDGIYDLGPPGNLVGVYTGPNGSGQFAAESGTSTSAQVYGGSYLSDVTLDGGTFLMAFRGSAIEGVATADGDSTGVGFTGTLSGNNITISSPNSGGYTMHGVGTLNPTSHHVNGRFNVDYNSLPADSGAWSGDLVNTP